MTWLLKSYRDVMKNEIKTCGSSYAHKDAKLHSDITCKFHLHWLTGASYVIAFKSAGEQNGSFPTLAMSGPALSRPRLRLFGPHEGPPGCGPH